MLKTANDLSAYTLAAGEPFFLEVQLQDSTGAVLDLSARAFVLSFYRDDRSTAEAIDGEQLIDATGRFLRFARDGRFSEKLYGQNLMVELAERYLNGRSVVTMGRLTVERSAAGVSSFGNGIVAKFVTRVTVRENAVLGGPPAFTQQQLNYSPDANAPPVTLGVLTLSGTLRVGTPSSGTIDGATTGSSISESIVGLTADSSARTYAWDGSGGAGTFVGGLVETHPNATNSGRASPVTIAAAPAVTLGALALSGTLKLGVTSNGTIAGATTGSTITDTLPGLTINSGARTYSFDGTGSAGTFTNALVETHPNATNSGRETPVTIAAAALLNPLTLSNTSGTVGQAFTSTVGNGYAGSAYLRTLAATTPAGLSASGSTVSGTPTEAASAIVLVEALYETAGDASTIAIAPAAARVVVTGPATIAEGNAVAIVSVTGPATIAEGNPSGIVTVTGTATITEGN